VASVACEQNYPLLLILFLLRIPFFAGIVKMSILGVTLKAVCTGLAAYIILQAWNYLTSPIRGIPGPFLAKFTNLWRLVDTYNGRSELTHQLLHKRYGPAVRIGPNLVSLGDPSLLHKIYDSRGIFKKVRVEKLTSFITSLTFAKDRILLCERYQSWECYH
jgi:hypothetical protein